MVRSPSSGLDPDDAHLRHLLDQRATRAHLHSRVHSLSEASDTPSVYSHAYFSPQTQDMSSNFASPYRDRLHDLAVSMLDMEDDPRSSYSPSVDHHKDSDDSDRSTIEQDQGDDDMGVPRMSLLGPKMRFHSKAPWELDNTPVNEEQYSDDDVDSQSGISFSSLSKGVRTRHFRLGGSKSTHARRSSRDSTRSRRTENKSSFETASARSAIQTLAQASLSTTSLGAGAPRPIRSASPTSIPPSSSPRSPAYSSRSGNSESRPSFAYSIEDTHPYARSDYTAPSLPSKSIAFPAVSQSDTPAESNTSRSFQYQPSFDVNTIHDPIPQSPRLQAFGREISSPVSFRSTTLPGEITDPVYSRTANLPGWTERSASSFNLISLEEARAKRSRNNTYQSTTVPPHSTHPVISSTLPEDEGESEHHSSSQTSTGRTRARSISAGARAKQALTSMVGSTPPKMERRGSEPAVVVNQAGDVKTLKQKRSGFLRLFNGGRDAPPPVPSLTEGYAAFNAQQQYQQPLELSVPRGMKVTRVPPPQVSPSMLQSSRATMNDDLRPPLGQPSSPKRTPPPLSLLSSNLSLSGTSSTLKPPFMGDVAQSAPANITEFPPLRLRPISTVFSAHFSDHILPSLTADDDPDTPSSVSPSTVISPVTPSTFTRPEKDSNRKTISEPIAEEEDQSVIIRALQDQIVTAKRAWQHQIWELEGQVRDLKAEVEDLRAKDNEGLCEHCGREVFNVLVDSSSDNEQEKKPFSVVNRPRARTGTGQSRFGSAV